jgi:hypothetical protein
MIWSSPVDSVQWKWNSSDGHHAMDSGIAPSPSLAVSSPVDAAGPEDPEVAPPYSLPSFRAHVMVDDLVERRLPSRPGVRSRRPEPLRPLTTKLFGPPSARRPSGQTHVCRMHTGIHDEGTEGRGRGRKGSRGGQGAAAMGAGRAVVGCRRRGRKMLQLLLLLQLLQLLLIPKAAAATASERGGARVGRGVSVPCLSDLPFFFFPTAATSGGTRVSRPEAMGSRPVAPRTLQEARPRPRTTSPSGWLWWSGCIALPPHRPRPAPLHRLRPPRPAPFFLLVILACPRS